MDLLFIVGAAWLLVPLTAFTEGLPRIAFGIAVVFFLPGYSLLALLFPRREDLSVLERFVLGSGMSLVLVPLIALMLNFTPWGFSSFPMVSTLAIVITLLSATSLYARSRRGLTVWSSAIRHQPQPSLRDFARRLRVPSPSGVLLGAALLALVVAIMYVTANPKTPEQFTEFYALGSGGKLADYPRVLVNDQQETITLAITNHEKQPMTYRVDVLFDGTQVQRIDAVRLEDDQHWETPLELRAINSGSRQEVEFLLYVENRSQPYRSLRLWLDVR